jgi:KEOPS complex subunit Pcc1
VTPPPESSEPAAPFRAGDPHAAVLGFDYDDERRARVVADAVAVEQGRIADERSAATVERDGSRVRVRVSAADLVALRAACNTWSTLVAVAEATAAVGAGSDGSDGAAGEPAA